MMLRRLLTSRTLRHTALRPAVVAWLCGVLLAACYRQPAVTPDAWVPTEEQMDSISFYTTHHYTENYNFLVTATVLPLVVQQPTEALSGLLVDTVCMLRDDRIVVADIMVLPADSVDSVWVQVARDALTIGWIRESALLPGVTPDNPISHFIDLFSDTHQLLLLAVIVASVAVLLIVRLRRRRAPMVLVRDIGSFYPSLLVLLVAAAAVLYSSIQLYAPDTWRHYYYHPTLNPFALPLRLALFVASLWAVLITLLATFDVVRRLSFADALLYWSGLLGFCAVAYVVFSVTTLCYVGYPLYAVFVLLVVRRYFSHGRTRYLCGHCGHPLRQKGRCPACGAENV